MSDRPIIILHDAQRNCWLQFSQCVALYAAHRLEDVVATLQQVEQAVETENLWAAGFVSYEAAPAFDAALVAHPAAFPLVWFGLYRAPELLPEAALLDSAAMPPIDWTAALDAGEYQRSIQRIKAYIQAGDTYQVNYTYRLRAPFAGEPWSFFTQLAQAQRAQYGAFISTPEWAICSASPELFFSLRGRELISCPMKGTMPRGLTWADDRQAAERLQQSEKDRAENVMIVDMVRNDMAHVAELGSVEVTHLFEVEPYPTLWQMTSTVRCATNASLTDIFRALFPAASITGAPKPRSMQIIAELEPLPRNLYTGSIGFLAPQRRAQFNVAIRTVVIDRLQQQAEYGVGGGIVWDSTPDAEYEECRTKARVLTQRWPDFALLETLLWAPADGYFWLDRHLDRLAQSAQYFAYSLDREALLQQFTDLARSLPQIPHKIRLLLPKTGAAVLESQPLTALPQPARVCLAPEPIDSSNPFLYHKTTQRQVYEQARRACPGYDDVLLWNERGELTESCMANVMVEVEGEWLTPPVECGLLPGIYRSVLLEQGKLKEQKIPISALHSGSKLFLMNSVRQLWSASLMEQAL